MPSSHVKAPAPIGDYKALVERGAFGFISGQLPIVGDQVLYRGRIGETVDFKSAREAAVIAAHNVLAQLHEHLGLKRFAGLCRVDGILAASPTFTDHAGVMDAASQVFIEALGPELGAHSRSVCAASSLPGGACIELITTIHLAPEAEKPRPRPWRLVTAR